MMRVLLLLCIILVASSTADGQIYTMHNNSVTDPSGTLHDSGGPSGNYANNEDYTFTICPPSPCDCLALNFESLLIDTAGDTLFIHNGNSTSAPLLASLTGINFPTDLFLDSGCATLRFSSNTATNSPGWKTTWSCSCFPGEMQTSTSAYTTTELIEDLFVSGSCVEVSNISFTGNSDAIGSFSNGGVIGIESGIVLSTGFINNIPGPNNFNTSLGTNPILSGISDDLGSSGDSDLNTLLTGNGQTTTNASSIEFDFVPTTNEISFQYIFASDEYPEFVCSEYNDVFAFFISGPGFTGSENIALIPGTTTPVAINSVNSGAIGSQGAVQNCNSLDNSDYYINSTGNLSFEFDGFTTILTATAPVTSCESYHIKLVIADVIDWKYDSAVFLGANSFEAGEGALISAAVTDSHSSPNEMYENCESGFFLFERGNPDDTSEPLVIDFEVTGTATAGIDYSPLPGSIVIPIGQTSTQIDINSFLDGISEGSESIIVTVLNNACVCDEGGSSAQINIIDNPEFEATLSIPDYCLHDFVTFSPTVIGGIAPLTYNWGAGTNSPSVSFLFIANKVGVYYVTVTDDCGSQATASVNLDFIPAPSIPQLIPVDPLCQNSTPFDLQAFEEGGSWTGDGITNTNAGTFNPTLAQSLSTPPFSITYTLANQCGVASNTIDLDFPLPPTATISGDLTVCPGAAVEESLSVLFTGEAPWSFTYALDDSEITSIENITDNPYEFIVNQIGNITITAINNNNCDGTFSGLATISEFSIPTINISGGGTLCDNQDSANIDFIIVNGAAPYDITYTDGTTQFNQQIVSSPLSIPVSLSGNYEILSITDANGCEGNFSGTATVLDTDLNIDSAIPHIANCQDNDGSITNVVISGGNSPFDYFWYDDAGLLLGTSTTLPGITAGTYTLIIMDALLCSDTLSLMVGEAPPPSIQSPGIPTASLCSEDNGSIIGTIFSGGEPPYTYIWKDSLDNVVSNTLDLFNVFAGTYTFLVEDVNGCKDSIEVSIADFPAPNLTGGTSNSANCNESNGSITGIAVENGVPPYNYQWTGENGTITNNSLDLLNIPSGNYTILVTDDNGCTHTLSFNVQDTESPEINDAITNPSLCSEANGSITDIDITGGSLPFSYEWQNKDGEPIDNKLVLEGVPAGIYTLIVTDIYGCKGLSEYTIGDKPSPFLNQGEATPATCNEDNGSITNVNTQGGYPPFEYEWTNNSTEVIGTNINLEEVGLGDYTLQITDSNGCTDEISFGVLTIVFPTLTEGNVLSSTCGNQNGAVQNIEIQGGIAPFTIQWYNEAGEIIHNTLNLQNIAAGNYELIVTDYNGCTANTSIEITDTPAPEITGGESLPSTCGNSDGTIQDIQIQSDTTLLTYEWYNTSSELVDTTLILQNVPAGTYKLIVTDDNGCTANTSIEITNIPPPQIIGGEITPSSCSNNNGAITSIEVSGNIGEVTYQWQNQAEETLSQTATLSDVPQGDYTLIVTDENGCETSQNFNIPDSTAPQLIGGEIQNATCGEPNGSITNISIQNGTALFTFEWQNEIGETIEAGEVTMNVLQLENLEEGLYTIIVTDSNDCIVSLQFTIEDTPLPQLSGGNITEATCGESDGSITDILVADGTLPYTFEWTNEDDEVIGTELNIENLAFGNYTLEVADSNNCVHRIEFLMPQISTEPFDGGTITPANCGEADGSITGINIEGNTTFFAFEWANEAGEIVGNELDIENLESGTYTLTFTDFNTCIHVNDFFIPQVSNPSINGGLIIPANCGEADGSITEINIDGDPTLFVFEWTNEAGEVIGNELDIENLESGNYSLQTTDSNNCIHTTNFFVPQISDEPLDGGLVTPSNCGEADGSITGINIEGDTTLFTFEWTNSEGEIVGNELDVDNLEAGIYTLTFTDLTDCIHIVDFLVPETTESPLQGGVVSPSNCGEADGSITEISVDGDPTPYTFEWRNTAGEIIGDALDLTDLSAGEYTILVTDENGCNSSQSFVVLDEAAPELTGGIVSPANCGQADGSITNINIEGGAGDYTFLWTDETGESRGEEIELLDIPQGNYLLTATDAAGCVAVLSFEIDSTEAPELLGGVVSPQICDEINGGIAAVEVNGGNGLLDFTWFNSNDIEVGTNLDLKDVSAGFYTLVVTDENGCTAELQLEIPHESAPQIGQAAINNARCGQANGSIQNVDMEGGTTPYTFTWTDADTNTYPNTGETPNLLNAGAGIYTLEVVDANDCSSSLDFEILDEGSLVASGGLVAASTCGDANGSIEAIDIEGGVEPFDYEWRDSNNSLVGTSETLEGVLAGNYTLDITDNNGCEASLAFEVLDIAAPILTGGIVGLSSCGNSDGEVLGVAIEGGMEPYVFHWQNAEEEFFGDEIDLTDVAAGDYTLLVSDANDCEVSLGFNISDIGAPSISGGSTSNTICGSSDGRISGIEVSGETGDLTLQWTDALGELLGENMDISNLLAGEYTLTVEDENGCIASENFVVEDILPPSILGATINPANCAASDGSITGLIVEKGTPPFDYEWRFVETNQVIGNTAEIENLAAGIYALVITDDNDCTDSQQFEITNPDAPILNLEEVTASECGEEGTGSATISVVGGTAPNQIEWNTGPPQFTPTASNLRPGEYEVTVQDANDCVATLTAIVPGSLLPPIVDCGIQNANELQFVWTPVEGAISYRVETDLGTIDTVFADQLSYILTGVPLDATVNISVMALGSELCGNSEAANHDCTKSVECDPIEVSIGLPNDAFCINEAPVVLTTNPVGGILEGNGLTDNLFAPALAGLGEHTIDYTYTDEMGCDFSASETIVVVETPFAAMSMQEVICLGDRAHISFEGSLPVGASLQWDFGNGDFSDAVGPHNIEWNETGIYTVQLSIDNGICMDETSMEIVVSDIGLEVSENQLVESGTEIDLSATIHSEYGELTELEWASSFDNLTGCNDCPNTTAKPFDATYYEITAINEHGCEANEEIFIEIIPVPVLIAPNAFSPNGDGINDVFKFEGKHLASIEFSIFSRWGQKLFEGNSLEDYWDGSFKGQTSELGVYVYSARAFSLEGEEIVLQGNISLVR